MNCWSENRCYDVLGCGANVLIGVFSWPPGPCKPCASGLARGGWPPNYDWLKPVLLKKAKGENWACPKFPGTESIDWEFVDGVWAMGNIDKFGDGAISLG